MNRKECMHLRKDIRFIPRNWGFGNTEGKNYINDHCEAKGSRTQVEHYIFR